MYKGRSKWKGLYLTTLLNKKVVKKNFTKGSVISYHDLGKVFRCYCGKKTFGLKIKDKMVGYKLGQFLVTKKLGSDIHKFNRINLKKQKQLQLKKRSKSKGLVKKKPVKSKVIVGKKRKK